MARIWSFLAFGQMFIGQRFCFLTARADFFSVYDKKIFFLHLEKSSPLTNGLSCPIFQHYCQTQQMTNTKPVTENFGSSVVLMIFRRSEAGNTENTQHRINFHGMAAVLGQPCTASQWLFPFLHVGGNCRQRKKLLMGHFTVLISLLTSLV